MNEYENESAHSINRHHSTLGSKAIDYLRTWKSDRSVWKFQKVRQIWLLANMYDEVKVRLRLDGEKGKLELN
jgi:WKF domain